MESAKRVEPLFGIALSQDEFTAGKQSVADSIDFALGERHILESVEFGDKLFEGPIVGSNL